MDNQMLGEIRMFSYGTMPKGWLPCDGQILIRKQYEALWNVLGPTYGGDGEKTFALPDLRGRVPLNRKIAADQGKTGGEETHVLTAGEMPKHTHQVYGLTGIANSASPADHLWADRSGKQPFSTRVSPGTMSDTGIDFKGAGEKHENMPPFFALNFGICVEGIYGNRDGTLGELMIYAGFPNPDHPRDWAVCNGQTLQIAQNTTLFSLLGNNYGGNGTDTFGLPDLREAAPIHCGKGDGLTKRKIGDHGGSAEVTLTKEEMPQHTHTAKAAGVPSTTNDPNGNIWAISGGDTRGGVPLYTGDGNLSAMNPNALGTAGGDKPHNNMPPYIIISYLICTNGKYPDRP